MPAPVPSSSAFKAFVPHPLALQRSYSTRLGKPAKNHPSPLGFVALALAAFGAFAFIAQKRHTDPEKHLREKRIPHPNPLIPPRTQEPQ
ncbi:hypothetical protein ACQY0O_005950 [Thecaphora frezii]